MSNSVTTKTKRKSANADLYVIGAGPYSIRKNQNHKDAGKNGKSKPSRAEILAQKEAERMIALQNMAQTGSWEIAYDENGIHISESLQWSDQLFRIYGYEPHEVALNSELFYQHVHPEDLDEMTNAMAEGLVLKKSFNVGHRIIDKHGVVKYVQQRGEFVFDKGKAISLIGITQDLTEKKSQLLELQSTQSNFRNILENTDTGYILIDKACRLMSFNHKANEFAETLSGRPLENNVEFFDFVHRTRRNDAKAAIHKVLNSRKALNREINFRLGDSGDLWLRVRISPIHNSQEEILGLTVALDDITEQKQWMLEKEAMNKRLVQRNEALEQFAFIISHNLRAPLANILGLSQLITQLSPEDEIFPSTVEGLHQSSSGLDQVVKDLSTILKMRDNLKDGESQVELLPLIKEALNSLEIKKDGSDLQLDLDFKEVGKVEGIKAYLLSIFTNLIGNSIKYSRKGVSLKISIQSSVRNGSILLKFQDNGLGIDLDEHGQNVFKLYKRFHDHVEGRGMGLYMVHSQVLALGGDIEVESEVGKGTCFTIQLPA